MPRYTPKSFEQILAGMVAKTVTRTSLRDVGDASVVKHALAAAARQDAQLYYQSSLLLKLFSIDDAAGEDLDERAKDIQPGTLRRIAAAKALGEVVFSRRGTTGSTAIAAGQRVSTASGATFVSTAAGSITATSPEQISGHGVGRDSAPVPILAEIGGSAGNVALGEILRFVTKPAGVDEVTNLAKTQYGVDVERDDQFRARLRKYVASLARCNPSALESLLIGAQDPVTGRTIRFATVVEDIVNRGNVKIYIDDGSGSIESFTAIAEALPGTWTWAGTTTVAATDTSTVTSGDFIRLDASATTWFEIDTIVPNTSVTLLNPGAATIPTGAGGSSRATEVVTAGLNGPPAGTAVGGETVLWTNHTVIRSAVPVSVMSDVRGNLVQGSDWVLNPMSGQINFLVPLVAGEKIVADYTFNTGLLAFAQKLIDGDPNDRENYPGYRAAGVYVEGSAPQVLLQNVVMILTISEGFTISVVQAQVRDAVLAYINGLPGSSDLLRSELTEKAMGVDGVYDVQVVTPAANITILDDQLARSTTSNVSIS